MELQLFKSAGHTFNLTQVLQIEHAVVQSLRARMNPSKIFILPIPHLRTKLQLYIYPDETVSWVAHDIISNLNTTWLEASHGGP